MARTRQILSENALKSAIEAGKLGIVDSDAEQKAFAIDVAQNASNPAKLAEIIKLREARIRNAVEVFSSTHVKVLNRVIRAFDVTISNAEKLRIVAGFIEANGGLSKVASLVNNAENEKAKKAKEKSALSGNAPVQKLGA